MDAIAAVFVSSLTFYKCRAAIKTLDGLVAGLACRGNEFYSGELKPGTRAQWINWMLHRVLALFVHLWSVGSPLSSTMAFRSSRHYSRFTNFVTFSFLLFSRSVLDCFTRRGFKCFAISDPSPFFRFLLLIIFKIIYHIEWMSVYCFCLNILVLMILDKV